MSNIKYTGSSFRDIVKDILTEGLKKKGFTEVDVNISLADHDWEGSMDIDFVYNNIKRKWSLEGLEPV